MAKELTLAVGAALLVAAGCAVLLVAAAGGVEGEPERLRFAVSIALPYVVGGLVALIGVARGVPRYAMAVGAGLVPLSVVSLVTLPLLALAIPLVVVGLAATRPGWSMEIPVSLVITAGLVASLAVLFLFDEPVAWVTDDGIAIARRTTWTGSVVSAGILVALVGLTATVRTRRTPAPGDPAYPRRGPAGRLP